MKRLAREAADVAIAWLVLAPGVVMVFAAVAAIQALDDRPREAQRGA